MEQFDPSQNDKKSQKTTLVGKNYQGSEFIAVGQIVNAPPVPTQTVYYP